MSGKHTPGPWTFKAMAYRDSVIVNTEGEAIAITKPMGGMQGMSEFAANTALIAAAPDLLEVLKSVLPVLDCQDVTTPIERGSVKWNRIEAAIAKAEGGRS